MRNFDVAIVGGGLAGYIAALAFSKQGFETAIIANEAKIADQRTTALMNDSLDFLDTLGVWQDVKPHSAPLRVMQIIDATGRLLRAPTLAFKAAEIDLDAFGYNIPNGAFLDCLEKSLQVAGNVTHFTSHVKALNLSAENVTLSLENNEELSARVVVGADGAKSLVRAELGIDVRSTPYRQSAVVLNFSHERSHADTSTEFHTETGPFTQVPLGPNRSSLVWVVRPEQAADLLDMTDAALNRRIEERMQSMLGKVQIETRPQAWPLTAMTAKAFGKGSAMLIGEAAHRFPPIGAQGLNLSLRDIQQAVDLAISARATGNYSDVGQRYDRKRKADVWTRTAGIDILNRSLLSAFLPVQFLRSAGLHILGSVPPVRHFFIQEGVAPGRSLRHFPNFLREKLVRKKA